MFGEGFAQQAHGAGVDGIAVAAVGLTADTVFQPARRTEFTDQTTAGRIDVVVLYVREIRAAPCLDTRGQLPVAWFEERPGQRAVQIQIALIAVRAQFNLPRTPGATSRQTRCTPVRNRVCSCKWPGLALPIRLLRRCSCSIPGAASSSW